MDKASTSKLTHRGEFTLLCIGAYMLTIIYGTTFLIPTVIGGWGGDAAYAGVIISSATISTVALVILTGHITDFLGPYRAVAFASIPLSLFGFGFWLSSSIGVHLLLFGLLLGIGWGLFYTVGPILIAGIVDKKSRSRYLALLSGSMMAGIGTGPLIGRACTYFGYPIEQAFVLASIFALCGGLIFHAIGSRAMRRGAETPQVSRISLKATIAVARSAARLPIIMVCTGACIFGGLSSFQAIYAAQNNVDYALFFIGFISAAVGCRLLLSGYVVAKDPHISCLVLTGMTTLSLIGFIFVTGDQLYYFLSAALLGVGYGLTYSVINGLAANDAPPQFMPQSLLLFSLAYFVGVFGFPLIAGYLIVGGGIESLLTTLVGFAVLNNAICVYRIVYHRKTK